MKTRYYRELPEGYAPDMVIDVKNKKLGILMNIAALIITVGVYLLTECIIGGYTLADWLGISLDGENIAQGYLRAELLSLLAFWILLVVYLVLHELTHGAAYKLLTREKLKFGFTWSAAYCGVPDLYVTRETALTSLLAPFVLFDVIFIVAAVVCGSSPMGLIFKLMFAVHFGGCVGDLYDTLLLLTRYRGGCLMNDDGPKQIFYVCK